MVAAVVLPEGFEIEGIDDSKKLTARRREVAYESLVGDCEVAYHIEVVGPEVIDSVNILQATWDGMRAAVDGLRRGGVIDYALIDGVPVPDFPVPSQAIVKGDGRSLSIAAASILAKVTRDRIMVKLGREFPQYGFEKHKGYPTKWHLEMLDAHGPVAAHRRSFAPVAAATAEARELG